MHQPVLPDLIAEFVKGGGRLRAEGSSCLGYLLIPLP